jgi:hypothetical protein
VAQYPNIVVGMTPNKTGIVAHMKLAGVYTIGKWNKRILRLPHPHITPYGISYLFICASV